MIRTLRSLVLLAAALGAAHAYALFDEVVPMVPVWQRLPVAATAATYRVRPLAADRVALEVRNPGSERLVLALGLVAPYADGATTGLSVDPEATASVELAVSRFDRELLVAPVAVASATAVAADGTTRALAVPPRGAQARPGLPATLPAVTPICLVDDPGFAVDRLAVSLLVTGDRLDVHVLNRSHHAIHCDLRIPDLPGPGARAPRLHLLPGAAQELVLPASGLDARAALALVQVWNVRIGADEGPAIAPRPDDHAWLPDPPEGFLPLAAADEGTAAWNPRAAAWRLIDLGGGRAVALVRNQTALPLRLEIAIGGAATPIELPAHGEASARLAGMVSGAVVTARAIVVAGRPLEPPSTLRAVAAPAHALPVTLREDDGALNPLALVYTVARDGDGRATVTFFNRGAAAVHADWAVAGYQDGAAANPRLHLEPGASATLGAALGRSDARLAIARCDLWRVRVGADAP